MEIRNIAPEERSTIQKAACFLLGATLVFTGTAHLTWDRVEFLAQVPPWVPVDKNLVVVLSGIVEIVLGVGLALLSKYRVLMGWIVALFFVLVFPGNISQFTHHINAFGLNSDLARGIRLFFQPVFIAWALWSSNAWYYARKAWRPTH